MNIHTFYNNEIKESQEVLFMKNQVQLINFELDDYKNKCSLLEMELKKYQESKLQKKF